MFASIFQSIKKIYLQLVSPLQKFFAQEQLSESDLAELKVMLIEADLGFSATERLLAQLRATGSHISGETARSVLRAELIKILHAVPTPHLDEEAIIILVGINGSGKTTCAAKLAYRAHETGKNPLLVAADTFRAAAVEQLSVWASQYNISLIKGQHGQDPASVVFAGCTTFRSGIHNQLIIDTAGRLQTKNHLMEELGKIRRVIAKQFPEKRIVTLLTIDSMLGQNSLEQARMFRDHVALDGIILTKLDGTGKGGVIFTLAEQLQLPVCYVTTGEQIEQIQRFDAQAFVDVIVGA